MAYASVRTDNMSGTTLGKNLVSLKYSADIENGCVLAVGGYESAAREVRVASAPGAETPLGELALIASEEVVKSKKANGLNDFINEQGSILRGYRFVKGDIFSVTKEAFASGGGTAAVGQVASIKNAVKMTLATAGVGTTIGSVVHIEGKWIAIEVA